MDNSIESPSAVAPSWDELCAQIPLSLRVQMTDTLIDGLAALHQAIDATSSGTAADMLRHLTEAAVHPAARDALTIGIADLAATDVDAPPSPLTSRWPATITTRDRR
jgi:hypothetical protein